MIKDAIEHYSMIDMKKAQHFQRKLTNLLMNPSTIHIIQQQQLSAKTAHIDVIDYERKLRNELNLFNSQSATLVKSMIVGTDKKLESQNKLITRHLETQQSNLNNRILARQKSKILQSS